MIATISDPLIHTNSFSEKCKHLFVCILSTCIIKVKVSQTPTMNGISSTALQSSTKRSKNSKFRNRATKDTHVLCVCLICMSYTSYGPNAKNKRLNNLRVFEENLTNKQNLNIFANTSPNNYWIQIFKETKIYWLSNNRLDFYDRFLTTGFQWDHTLQETRLWHNVLSEPNLLFLRNMSHDWPKACY